MIECDVVEELAKSSDHIPIRTILGDIPELAVEQEEWKIKDADFKAFRGDLTQRLARPTRIGTQLQLDTAVEALTVAIKDAMDTTVPKMRRTPKMRPGWDEECSRLISKVKRAKRVWKAEGTEPSRQEYKALDNKKKKKLARALTDDHRERVSKVEGMNQLWPLCKWIKNRGIPRTSFMPWIRDLQGNEHHDNEGKARALQERLFPQPPPANLSDIPETPEFLPPLPFPDIEDHEIRRALSYAPNDKAPGADGFTNRILKEATTVILPFLLEIYNASIRLQYWPAEWKEARVVILRKPSKSDYHDPKSYRPISLLKTMSKIMEAILATRIAATAEIHNLLPITHCGGRKSTSTEHAVHLLLEEVQTAWRNDEVASLLTLDISGAFDNVNHRRLLWNIRELGFHENLVGWIGSFITGRTGRTRFNEGLMAPFDISTGIPQGSPLSPILFLLYNYKALNVAKGRALVTGYIDDTCVLVTGKKAEENSTKLGLIHDELQTWASQHGVSFAPQKYELIHFHNKTVARKSEPGDLRAPVEIRTGANTVLVKPKKCIRYLGVWMDSNLTGEQHLEKATTRATQQVEALRGITGAAWGVGTPQMIHLYKSTVLPRLTYACSTWAPVGRGQGFKMAWNRCRKKLEAFQRRALALLSGAFKTTAGIALDTELNVEPIRAAILKAAMMSANKIRCSHVYDRIKSIRERGSQKRKLKSPLHGLETYVDYYSKKHKDTVPEINTAYSTYPWWKPPITIVPANKEEALGAHHSTLRKALEDPRSVIVYSDGSERNGGVGAAAHMLIPQVQLHTEGYSMGSSHTSSIYVAEAMGLATALSMVKTRTDGPRNVTIFTDNQAVIARMANPSNRSGQFYFQLCINLVSELRERGCTVTIQWVPGHKDVFGNEKADIAAKDAAEGRFPPPPVLIALETTARRTIRQKFKKRWESAWRKATTGKQLREILDAPHKKTLAWYHGMPKLLATTIIRARTGAIGLKGYLGKINIADTRECHCGSSAETVKHLVLGCSDEMIRAHREDIWGKHPPRDINSELCDREGAMKIARFLLKTGLLGQQGRPNESARSLIDAEPGPEDLNTTPPALIE